MLLLTRAALGFSVRAVQCHALVVGTAGNASLNLICR